MLPIVTGTDYAALTHEPGSERSVSATYERKEGNEKCCGGEKKKTKYRIGPPIGAAPQLECENKGVGE